MMDDDNPRLRSIFGYMLRSHVSYQDGASSLAPSLVFADADYEAGDGTCGLHADGKSANEPAIVYVRADALLAAIARAEKAEAEAARLREVLDDLRHAARDVDAQLDDDGVTEAAHTRLAVAIERADLVARAALNTEGEGEGDICNRDGCKGVIVEGMVGVRALPGGVHSDITGVFCSDCEWSENTEGEG